MSYTPPALASGMGASSPVGSGSGGANIDQLERTGRRLTMLQRYAPELVTSSPPGAMALAESNTPDGAMLNSASGAVDYANLNRILGDLKGESPEVARAMWASTPTALQRSLSEMGYDPPKPPKPKGGNRWGINLPDFLPGPNELTISRDTPVLGPIGNVQAGLGEGLEELRGAAGDLLRPFEWAGKLPAHTMRMMDYFQEEGHTEGQGFSNIRKRAGEMVKAWQATDESDGYVRPAYREKARNLLGGDETAYRLAHYTALRLAPDEILQEEHLEPGSQEATQLLMDYQEMSGADEFKRAVHTLSVGQVSVGRGVSQALGLDDTDAGWGRYVSGTFDAGFAFVDPTIVAGELTKVARVGKAAFTLETAADVERGFRMSDMALVSLRAREGSEVGTLARDLGPIRPWEMRRGAATLAWADRVAEGFRTGQLAKLSRDVPGVATAIGAMSDYHAIAGTTEGAAKAMKALDTPLGVVEWLQGRDGLLAVAGTRLAGGSPLVAGLRIPSLTTRDRIVLEAKGGFQRFIDWGRIQNDPFHGDKFTDYFRNVLDDLGKPATLTRQMARWSIAHTAGSAGKVLSALTVHTPYSDVLPLFGEEGVQEFTRLVNTGIFAGFSRKMMDDYVDNFIKARELTTRSTQVEQFLGELFKLGGVDDTDFVKRFVGRYRQAYSINGDDVIDVGGITSKAGRLVDAQHADALAIPAIKDFLGNSYRANWLRAMFHNPGSAMVDARLGRAWKPSVLLRIGFIPRAAGEEAFHFILKHGPRTYLGAKGAEWMVQDEVAHHLRAELTEARALGQTDKVNRLEQSIADAVGALPPVRAMMAGSDRMFARVFESGKSNASPWRQRLADKVEAYDPHGTRGVVSGLERFANRKAIEANEVWSKIAQAAHMPSKAQLGKWMSEHWDPWAAVAARDFIDHPWVAKAYAEQIGGSTMTPFEFIAARDVGGAPIRKQRLVELRGGLPVVEEVKMRPLPGEYDTIDRTATQDAGFFEALYSRHNWIKSDRVGNSVLANVMPRFTGPWSNQLAHKMGFGGDVAALRADLNRVWAHVGETSNGKKTLRLMQRYIDGDEALELSKGALGGRLKRLFEESGSEMSAGKLLSFLDDPKMPAAAKRWMIYENVDPERLIEDFPTLVRKMRNTARARLSRPDMQRHLTESRLYADGGPTLAKPVTKGMHKVYVPLMPASYEAIGLGDDFVALATKRIVRIGGYSPEAAESIARRVAATSATTHVEEMATKPLASWAASDPRVADAVMAAAEQTTGVKPIFGILEVPTAVAERAASAYPQGLITQAKAWQQADDYTVEPWRLMHTQATDKQRRLVKLEIGDDWWDDATLDAASQAWEAKAKGTTRWYSTDNKTWTRKKPYQGTAAAATESPFWFIDHPGRKKPLGEDLVGAHKLPGMPGPDGKPMWTVTGRQASAGLGEAEALESVADTSMNELLETLTTLDRAEIDDDVLHEIVEPLLRPDRRHLDVAGNPVSEPGYTYEHLVGGTPVDRLPTTTYGPTMASARDFKWSNFVQEWFNGPVNRALSSVIRKPMFLHVYGQQLRNNRAVAGLFVEANVAADASRFAKRIGLGDEALDDIVLNAKQATKDDDLIDLLRTAVGDDKLTPDAADLKRFKTFVAQRNHGLDLARENAMNRTMQLVIPFIDDHRIRSAFQNYVGNFIPFLFAEEQFLKRWVRSTIESPQMIRKAQLGLNGLRDMGTVRKDDQGRLIFNYPLVGEATRALSNVIPDVFGVDMAIPYAVQMTGDVGYALPGFGDQFGVPSTGPLVGMGVEFLSRHYPELASLEEDVVGRGANQPLWHYIVPSGVARIYEAGFGDMDQGQLASLNLQAMQMMAINGQLPPEDATPEERRAFLERVRGQVRLLSLARSIFGLNSPAAPVLKFESEDLSDEFNAILQADVPMEEAVMMFLQKHPDADPQDLLAVTVSRSESEFSGMDMPTDKAFNWVAENDNLVKAFPAASAWLIPRADSDDPFSYRAWQQQVARGLRKRKHPEEFLDDLYFSAAARDYFDARDLHEEAMLTATGGARRTATLEWDSWKKAYFNQHPTFENMLQDPTRQQRRRQALDELTTLAADPEGPVPDDMREMVQRYDDYRLATSGLRGDRRGAVVDRRKALTQELVAWMQWHIKRHPELTALYLRTIEPELNDLDEDAAGTGVTS